MQAGLGFWLPSIGRFEVAAIEPNAQAMLLRNWRYTGDSTGAIGQDVF